MGSIFNKIDRSIKDIFLKIYKTSVILQNKPTKLRSILEDIIDNLSYKELYKFYNNKQIKNNIEQLIEKEIKHLVNMYKNKKYEKLVNYLNEYKDTDKFHLIYNNLLLKLTVMEQLEFNKMFQEYNKSKECGKTKVEQKIKIETVKKNKQNFRNMIYTDSDNKTLYVEYGTYTDYNKINKIYQKISTDKINYRLVVIPILINNTYSLNYDNSENKNLYNLPIDLKKEMKKFNTSSVNIVMKKIIQNSINDIYNKINNSK